MTQKPLPVLIVGAGPVGLVAALELHAHGVPVTIIEPRLVVGHSRPRAKTTSARTMEFLRRLGVAGRVRTAAPLPVDWSGRVTFATNVVGEEVVHFDDCLGLRVPATISPERGQQISQGVFEEVLRERVAELPAITTLYGWSVQRLVDDGDTVLVHAVDSNATERTLRARWVIGADGPRSVVRAAMGATYEGSAGGRPNVNITFRSRKLARKIPHPPSIHYWVLDPQHPGVVGPLDMEGSWWAISTGTASVDDDAHARSIVRGMVGADIDVEIVATDPWQARMLLADRYRVGRMFIIGDAAHQNPPWGGHGFNTGVGDAVNLAWKLGAVIQGWAHEELLDSYESERRPIAAQTIDLARANMESLSIDLAVARPDTQNGNTRSMAAARIRALKAPEFYADGLVFGYGYTPDSFKQAPTPAAYTPLATPGNRLPHRLLRGVPVIDLLGPEFSLLGPAEAAVPLLDAAAESGVPLVHVEAEGELVLVRPDQHIAWTGTDAVGKAALILDAALRGFPSVDVDAATPPTLPQGVLR